MPEPITLIVGGVALYAWLKNQGLSPASLSPALQEAALAEAPATISAGSQPIVVIPPAVLATNASVVAAQEGVPLADALTPSGVVAASNAAQLAVPSDLVAALDDQTALMFRAYAAYNPTDFQMFLDRYADRLVLRNDLVIEMLTDPPEQGFQMTPGMLASMGNAGYKVIQALNGVAVGKSVDVFGVAGSVAGSIPGMNQDFVSSLQAAAMGYRAITGITDILAIASANGVSAMNFSAMTTAGQFGAGVAAYPGLAALPLAGVLMAVGLVVDIGFTIIGDKPDLQKAIDVALDVASLAVLFIPVIGIVIAIIIQLVKFIIDLFGEDLFGGGMSHEEREILETARYGENLNPMYPELSAAYTPRELLRVINEWGTGYCGGKHVVAMAVSVVLLAGDVVPVNGSPHTVAADVLLTYPYPGCYTLPAPYNSMTFDDLAWTLGAYASVNGIVARAQAGIIDWRKVQFEDPTEKLIMTRATPMRTFLVKHGLLLDQIDQMALEYRAQPHLNTLAASFGWPTWQELFAYCVESEWRLFNATVTDGSLSDFAQQNGHPTMFAFRAAAFAPFEAYYTPARAAATRLLANINLYLGGEMYVAMKAVYDAETQEGQWVVPPPSPLVALEA